jgi:methyl-accepting chemotaxis protein
MADNLTRQVRSISDVTKAVAAGNLTQKVNVDVAGEMLELKETVNTLSAFSSEVTRMAMEVGTRGILGGQAQVPGVKGTWEELTKSVNVRWKLTSQCSPTDMMLQT